MHTGPTKIFAVASLAQDVYPPQAGYGVWSDMENVSLSGSVHLTSVHEECAAFRAELSALRAALEVAYSRRGRVVVFSSCDLAVRLFNDKSPEWRPIDEPCADIWLSIARTWRTAGPRAGKVTVEWRESKSCQGMIEADILARSVTGVALSYWQPDCEVWTTRASPLAEFGIHA